MIEQLALLPKSWQPFIATQQKQRYFQDLLDFVAQREALANVYPPSEQRFTALAATDFSAIKVVIMGQDPYHGEHQAHGLSFSVPEGVPMPPSLKNIFKEVHRQHEANDVLAEQVDTSFQLTSFQLQSAPSEPSGNLLRWANQGVLLLNSVLTVEAGQPASHAKKGWEQFTQACIDYINEQHRGVVFLAWGKYAHQVCANIDTAKHCVIKTSHPSPLGARKSGADFTAFLGSNCFQQANEYLQQHGKSNIEW